MEIIDSYSYLENIAKYVLTENRKLIFDVYNLSGARLSGKTTSITIAIAKVIACAIYANKQVAVYACRKQSKSVPDLVEELKTALDDIELKYSFTGKSTKTAFPSFQFEGGSFIQVVGITKSNNTANLKGLAKCYNFDLAIDWVEEANECVKKDFQDLRFAIRGERKRVSITSCNPDLEFQDHIRYLNENVPFDMNKLKAYGEQLTVWTNKTEAFVRDGVRQTPIKQTILNHYTTFKVNPHLSDDAIMLLEDLKITDPQKAISWYYGCPGSLAGSVFGDYLYKVRKHRDFNVRYYLSGLDLGYSESIEAHPTTCQLVGADQNLTRLQVLEEFYHDNTRNKKLTLNGIYINLLDTLKAWMIKYQMNYLEVKTDYGSGGLLAIDVLNKMAKERNLEIRFVPVDKEVWYVKDRVEAIQMLMISEQLGIDRDQTPNLFRQLSLMVYQDTSTTRNKEVKIVDLNDDCFDAMTYAIMPILKKVINSNPLKKK